ncbi:hypothetical protein GCM10027277_07290 [Pseudoduganella ginsengisoli]|uniref:Copper resistance protein CopB n=1 Tax=Pseudoduganella ginsengisoli TaxID=1462440 RepID=A0A6L6Q921_9BURK|nr:hypothetical protein [Pseudoduganella ginsengisoli]MTW05926.1 hypothetical protein [Pseudoduganella ginsengisoli]
MKSLYALLFAAAGVPLAAYAQSPAPTYRSAFAGYQSTPETTQSPDQAWRQANRDVAASGHAVDHMHHGAMGHETQAGGPAGPGKMEHGMMKHGQAQQGTMNHAESSSAHRDHGKEAKPAAPQPQQHEHKDH